MPTFDDFNFGDDSGAVDTDPVPDNDNLDANQSSANDGEQDDVANYPEPGQDDRFEGGEPSEIDVQGNPNEPGAQVDHIPPVSKLRNMADPVTANVREMLGDARIEAIEQPRNPSNAVLNKALAELYYRVSDDDKEAIQRSLSNNLSFSEISRISEGMPSSYLSYEELDAMWAEFLDKGIWYPPRRYSRAQARRETAKLWGVGEQAILDGTFDFIQDNVAESDADDPIVEQFGDLLDATASLLLIPDSVINDIFDDQSMIALLEEYNNSEASWGRIDGQDDFANTIDNPSGVGELFDQLLVGGNDAFMAIDNAQDVDALVSSDFLGMDPFVEEMDIRDYVGDLTLNSDIIEFQNMGTNVLEDFDGVL